MCLLTFINKLKCYISIEMYKKVADNWFGEMGGCTYTMQQLLRQKSIKYYTYFKVKDHFAKLCSGISYTILRIFAESYT